MQNYTKIHGFSKFKIIFILALMSAIAPLSTDMYLPALKSVQESFNTSEFLTQLSIATFFIAFAFGQLIYRPLSDIFGRKKPLIVGIVIFMFSSLGCVLVDNVELFIVFRFLEALGGCAGVVIARAVVNDLFELKEAGAVFALMMVVSSLAPMLSPTFGSLLLKIFSWQSIFVTLFLLGVLLIFLVVFVLKESASISNKVKFSQKEIIKNYAFVLKDRPFLVYIFSSGFAMGAIFAYITGSSFVFIKSFGLSEQTYGFLFGLNSLGFIIAANINAKLVLNYSPYVLLPKAFFAMLTFGAALIFCSFLGFYAFEISLFFIISMLGFIMPNTTTLAMARFRDHSGTASALLGTLQFAIAGLVSFIVGFVQANTPFLLSVMIFGCIFLAFFTYFFIGKMVLKDE